MNPNAALVPAINVECHVMTSLERGVTEAAFEWSLSLVHFHMASQCGLVDETLVTNSAAEWPFRPVDQLVRSQKSRQPELLCTNDALVRTIGGVRILMAAQTLLCLENSVTERAAKVEFMAVHRRVALTIFFLDKRFAADVALPGTVAGVTILVTFQAESSAEAVTASEARKSFLLCCDWCHQNCGICFIFDNLLQWFLSVPLLLLHLLVEQLKTLEEVAFI